MSNQFQNTLAVHCAAVLTKLKASNLVNLNLETNTTLYDDIKSLNKSKTLACEILKENDNKVLLLIYNKKLLRKLINKKDNKQFLDTYNYHYKTLNEALIVLKERMRNTEFPHEIGIFLDYPKEDIIGYIEHKKCLYTGYWKVYSHVNEKKCIFEAISNSKKKLLKMINNGNGILNLIK